MLDDNINLLYVTPRKSEITYIARVGNDTVIGWGTRASERVIENGRHVVVDTRKRKAKPDNRWMLG